MKYSEIKKIVLPKLNKILFDLNFKKGEDGFFCTKINDECTIFIGIMTAGRSGKDHFLVIPYVAIEHYSIQRFYKELTGREIWTKYPQPVGYVMPQNTFLEWDFYTDGDFDAIANDLRQALIDYGIPYLLRQANDFSYYLEEYDKNSLLPWRRYVLPIGYCLNGDYDKMNEFMNSNMELWNSDHDKFKDYNNDDLIDYDVLYNLLNEYANKNK